MDPEPLIGGVLDLIIAREARAKFFGHAPFEKPHPLNCRESRQQTRKRGEVSETRVFVPTDRFINQIYLNSVCQTEVYRLEGGC